MIYEGHAIQLRSEEGFILTGTVLEHVVDDHEERIMVISDAGDEFDFVGAGDEWKFRGVYWYVVKFNPCLLCAGVNPSSRRNPMAYGHLPELEQDRLLGMLEESQRARVQLMDAEIRGDSHSAARWRLELRAAEKKLIVAEKQHGPAFRNPVDAVVKLRKTTKKTKNSISVRKLVSQALK